MLENYVTGSVQEQASVPQWGSSRNFDPKAHRRDAEVGSLLLLERLVLCHPEHAPSNVVVLPTPENIAFLPARRPTVRMIIAETAKFYLINPLEIISQRRSGEMIEARHMAMWLCRELTELSLPSIGKQFGDRDHTTVLNAIRSISKKLTKNERLRDDSDVIKLRVWDRVLASQKQ